MKNKTLRIIGGTVFIALIVFNTQFGKKYKNTENFTLSSLVVQINANAETTPDCADNPNCSGSSCDVSKGQYKTYGTLKCCYSGSYVGSKCESEFVD